MLNRLVLKLFALSLGLCLTGSQISKAQTTAEDLRHVSIHWHVVTNGIKDGDKRLSVIELKNEGNRAIYGSGWSLYFSFELNFEALPNSAPFSIQRFSGDFYKATPTANFQPLAPGETISIPVNNRVEAIIAFSVSPGGYFFVLPTGDPAKPEIVSIAEADVDRAIAAEQMFRDKTDILPPATPALRYKDNARLTELAADKLPLILPTPSSVKPLHGKYTINAQTKILTSSDLQSEANYLVAALAPALGAKLAVEVKPVAQLRPAANSILLKIPVQNPHYLALTANKSAEAYELWVNAADGIAITSKSPAGILYGIESLRQLIPVAALAKPQSTLTLPTVHVSDEPRFSYRALGLDVARNFQTKGEILKLLDLMAIYKFNTLQLHLADDEGWRIEIAGLPELTDIGSRRGFTPEGQPIDKLPPALDSGPFADANLSHGTGFYSRADFIQILKHANSLHIEIIPEIEGPGHARAAIQSMLVRYNHLKAYGKPTEAREFLLTDPDEVTDYASVQGYNDNVINVCIPSPQRFMEKVFTEIAGIYKDAGIQFKHAHVGGDEVPAKAWDHTKACLALPASERTGDALEHGYIESLGKLLNKLGATPTAWEEAVEGSDSTGKTTVEDRLNAVHITPVIWRNIWGEAGSDTSALIANAGYNVILGEASNLYLDMLYEKAPEEPGTYWAAITDTRQTFEFTPSNVYHATRADTYGHPLNPCKDFASYLQLTPEGRKHILGVQGDVWSERVLGPEMVEYFFFPRALAIAERAWAPEPKWESNCNGLNTPEFWADWNLFSNTLGQREFIRIDNLNGGYAYRLPPPGAILDGGGLLKANTAFPGLKIHYTTDGSEPTANSPLYTGPFKPLETVKLKSFDSKGRGSRSSTVEVK